MDKEEKIETAKIEEIDNRIYIRGNICNNYIKNKYV